MYQTLEQRAELIDAGVEGLPAFRVQFPPTTERPGPEGFEVAIDIPQNRLVFASTPERLRLLSGLFGYLDKHQNAFQQPIQLVAADETTAELAKKLTPEIKKMIEARETGAALPRRAKPGGELPINSSKNGRSPRLKTSRPRMPSSRPRTPSSRPKQHRSFHCNNPGNRGSAVFRS